MKEIRECLEQVQKTSAAKENIIVKKRKNFKKAASHTKTLRSRTKRLVNLAIRRVEIFP